MPIFLHDVEDRRVGPGAVAFEESEFPASFPYARWSYQSAKYAEYWQWFTGEVWNEETEVRDSNGRVQKVLKYPLQINHSKTTCMKHNYVLFGEVQDTYRPLVPVRVTPRRKPGSEKVSDDVRRRAEELEDFINRVWMLNNGRALQQEGGLIQQFLGGIVYRVSWAPYDESLEYGIRIEMVLPDFFLPVWDTARPDHLLEAWVVWRMPAREAFLKYGISNLDSMSPLYVEHWTEHEYSITVGGKPVTMKYDMGDGTFMEIRHDQRENPFGFVPFVYIPRERAGSFYGLSLLDDLMGASKEYNARLSDLGDIVHDRADRAVFAKNLTGPIKSQDLGNGRRVYNIGSAPPGGNDPDVFAVDVTNLPDKIADYPILILKQINRDTFVPPVAEGEDEGSQRSALTLSFRMWPLTSKIRSVRTYWTTGLLNFNRMIAKIAIMKGVGGITEEHLKDVDISMDWSPMIPRDREAEVNELIMAKESDMLSPVSGIRILNQVDDADDEYDRIKEFNEWKAKTEAMARPQPAFGGQTGAKKAPGVKRPKPGGTK
jgi:hypothetical protein